MSRCSESTDSTQADVRLHSLIFNDDLIDFIYRIQVEFVEKYPQLL